MAALRLRSKRVGWLKAALAIAFLNLVVGTGLYLTSAGFEDDMRRLLIGQLEQTTGGKTELREFHWNLSRLELEGRDVTIHGTEHAGQAPYFHADHVLLRLKVLSLFQRNIGLRELFAEHPVIHIMVARDGSTNQPVPRVKQNPKEPVDELFNLGVERVQIAHGELLWNDQKMPLDLTANDVTARLQYLRAQQQFEGWLSVGKIDGVYGKFRPVAGTADLHLLLARDHGQIESLKLQSEKSQIELNGRVTNWQSPKLEAAYNASLDLGQAGAIIRNKTLRAGTLEMRGSGVFSAADFSTLGTLAIKNLDWRDKSLAVADLQARANFKLDRSEAQLSGLSGTIAGGSFFGQAEVKNWSSAAPSGRRAEQSGDFSLQFSDFDLERLAATMPGTLPAARPRLAAVAQGEMKGGWRGNLRRLQSTFKLAVRAPSSARREDVPLEGSIQGDVEMASGELHLARASLTSRATNLQAAGDLGRADSRLKVDLHLGDFGELMPLLAMLKLQNQPQQLAGRGEVTGVVTGKLSQPAFAGNVQVNDFSALVPLPTRVSATTAAPPQPIAIAKMTADLQVSPSQFAVRNGNLASGGATAAFSASADLRKYQFDRFSPFAARVELANVSLEKLQKLARSNYPVTGTAGMKLQGSGTLDNPQASGSLQIAGGELRGMPYKSLAADLNLAQHQAQLSRLQLLFNGAQISGSGVYNLTSRVFQFQASGDNIDLAHLEPLQQPRFTMAGQASFHLQGSGTPQAPRVDGSLELRKLVLNGEPAGDLSVQATTNGADMRLLAQSNFERADIRLQGAVHLRDPWPAQMTLRFSRLDIDPLLSTYLHGRITEHSSVNGEIDLSGPLRRPLDLEVAGDLHDLTMDLQNVKLASEGPIRFSLRNRIFQIASAHIVGEGTDFSATGSLPLDGSSGAALRADGRLNLRLLESFNPNLVSYGVTTVAVEVNGSLRKPSLTGKIGIADAGFSLLDLPSGLSAINGTLIFNQDRLQIQSLTARTGGGQLSVAGFATYANGLYFDLTAQGTDMRLRYPPGLSAGADANLRFQGTLQSSQLSGDVIVTRFAVNRQFDFSLYLARSNQPPAMPKPESLLNTIQLNVRIVSTPELQVQTSLAKISGDADLRVRGTVAQPQVLGRVSISQGDLFFNGTQYHLERGSVLFVNTARIEPVLDLQATARVRDFDITLTFHGTLDKLSTTYRSDPPLPTADIIALLALGRTREEDVLANQAQPNLAATAGSALLGEALNATVSSRLQRIFGVSRIKIDPQAGGAENNPNARLTVEQQVSDKVTLTYITNLAQSAQQVIQMEIHLNRNVSLVGVRDQNGVVAVDLRMRQRKR